ncbi:MAG: hypothetical protein M3P93_06320 [Actinomycetota bacterium]|jgi:flagellum-specific peptidoglycan hydrolase FlgJ|nr:hypothetical protein [Actinomycetota bacterium]
MTLADGAGRPDRGANGALGLPAAEARAAVAERATKPPAGAAADAFVPVGEAAERSGASVSVVRGLVRAGQVRSRTGSGPRGERLEVALDDVLARVGERGRSRAGESQQEPGRTAGEPSAARPPALRDAPAVPLSTVETLERLSGELYRSGQRAARAEALAEVRERMVADLQREVEELQREAADLWEQNQELLRRVALAEAQLEAAAGQPEKGRWGRRRR